MSRRLCWSALLVVGGAAAVAALIGLRRVVTIGAGYKAKILASLLFVSGRTIDVRSTDEVGADSYWPMRFFRARVDDNSRRSVTVSLLGLWPRTAIYRPGLGATLLPPGSARFEPGAHVSNRVVHESNAPAPPPWRERAGPPSLDRLVAAAFTEPNRRRLRRTRAVVVVRDGQIIAEQYAPGFAVDTRFPGWSMTKSVLGAMVGILVGEGRLSLQDRELLPDWRAPDPRAAIRLKDLLRMRSGLRFDEVYSDLSSDVVEMLFNRPDAAAYAAGLPLISPPGTVWHYSSGTTNILSALLRRTVGEVDYFGWPRQQLFDPIGMTTAILEPDRSGTFVGSSFMLATARDWARFGQLYLQRGVWDGCQIVPAEWVRFSTSPTPQSPHGIYGAHWWLGLEPELGGGSAAAAQIPRDAFFAIGHEGQTLTVVPSLRLVVVRLGLSIYVDAWNHAAFVAELIATLNRS